VVFEAAKPVGAPGTAVHVPVPPPLPLLLLPHAGIRTKEAKSTTTSSELNLIRHLFPVVQADRKCSASSP